MFYINFEKSFTLACAFFYAQASAQALQPPSFTPRGGCGQSFNPHPWGNLLPKVLRTPFGGSL